MCARVFTETVIVFVQQKNRIEIRDILKSARVGEKNHFYVQHYRNKVDNFQEYVAKEEQFYDGCRKYINQNLEIRYACVPAAKTFPNFGLSFFCFFFLFWQVWQHTFKVWQLQIACLSRVTRFCELCQCIIRFSGMQLELILWIRLRGMLHEKLR